MGDRLPPAPPTWPPDLGHVLTGVLTALGGGGLLVAFGRAFSSIVNRLVPDGNRRLDDARDRRHERAERIQELEKDLAEMTDRYFAVREELIGERKARVVAEARLELLRSNLDMQKGDGPHQLPDEPRPPFVDDRLTVSTESSEVIE